MEVRKCGSAEVRGINPCRGCGGRMPPRGVGAECLHGGVGAPEGSLHMEPKLLSVLDKQWYHSS